ncbi:hypothetical protein TIFTF001_022864 [Ficus carica]|uniref:Uncharacterized protein n=1 Tax=Ficus carica TaxID=3494 RepID=A0AA88AJY5_FICCA|nr:hypothetical protein TIFTF001_022864 [Ficus carica]
MSIAGTAVPKRERGGLA